MDTDKSKLRKRSSSLKKFNILGRSTSNALISPSSHTPTDFPRSFNLKTGDPEKDVVHAIKSVWNLREYLDSVEDVESKDSDTAQEMDLKTRNFVHASTDALASDDPNETPETPESQEDYLNNDSEEGMSREALSQVFDLLDLRSSGQIGVSDFFYFLKRVVRAHLQLGIPPPSCGKSDRELYSTISKWLTEAATLQKSGEASASSMKKEIFLKWAALHPELQSMVSSVQEIATREAAESIWKELELGIGPLVDQSGEIQAGTLAVLIEFLTNGDYLQTYGTMNSQAGTPLSPVANGNGNHYNGIIAASPGTESAMMQTLIQSPSMSTIYGSTESVANSLPQSPSLAKLFMKDNTSTDQLQIPPSPTIPSTPRKQLGPRSRGASAIIAMNDIPDGPSINHQSLRRRGAANFRDPIETFQKVFFMTYETFCCAQELLDKIIERYSVPDTYDAAFKERVQDHVKQCLMYWMTAHPYDFTKRMLLQLETFFKVNCLQEIMSNSMRLNDEELRRSVIAKSAWKDCLAKMMKPPSQGGITFESYKSFLNEYHHVFSGSALVDWLGNSGMVRSKTLLMGGSDRSERELYCEMARELLACGVIVHIHNKAFVDSPFEFYRIRGLHRLAKDLNHLKAILTNAYAFELFENHAKATGFQGHVAFLQQVDAYRQIKSADARNDRAEEIYNMFLSAGGKFNLNLNKDLIKIADDAINRMDCGPDIFDAARESIFKQLESKCHVTFIESTLFSDLARVLQELARRDEVFFVGKDEEESDSKIELASPKLPRNFHGPVKFNSHKIVVENEGKRELAPGVVFEDIDELEIARQLTLINWELYTKLKRSEFLNLKWTKPGIIENCRHLWLSIKRFNEESLWVAGYILGSDRIKDRVKRMERILRIAQHLKTQKNYSSLMAFLGGINNAAVLRLKHTKASLSKPCQEILEDIENFMSNANNSKNYRESLANSDSGAVVPYLGLFLKDLIFIEEGNARKVAGLINFSQRKQIYDVLCLVLRFQNRSYSFTPVESLRAMLFSMPQRNEEELYRLSLIIEPRGAELKDIN